MAESDDALRYLRSLIPPGQDDRPEYRDVRAQIDAIVKARTLAAAPHSIVVPVEDLQRLGLGSAFDDVFGK